MCGPERRKRITAFGEILGAWPLIHYNADFQLSPQAEREVGDLKSSAFASRPYGAHSVMFTGRSVEDVPAHAARLAEVAAGTLRHHSG